MADRDIIFVCGDWKVTRELYRQRTARVVTLLRELGIGPKDRVGVALKNSPQFFEMLGAIAALKARVVPIAWRQKQDEINYLVEDSGAKLVVYDVECGDQFADVPGISLDEYETRLAAVEPASDVELHGNAEMDLYSSGTTGRPKAIERPEGAPMSGQSGVTAFLAMMGVGGPGETHLMCGPLYHSQPIGFANMALAAGHRVVMMPGGFDPERTLQTIERERVTWITAVPTHFVRILALPEAVRNKYDLSSLKLVLHSAAPCPRDVKQRAMAMFPPDTVWEIYGGTEGAMTMISPQEWMKKPGSVGRAFPPTNTLYIMDDDGNVLPAGEPGLIYAKPSAPFRYRGAPNLDAQTWRGELFTLGDVGHLDEDGFLYITDRKKDLIISGGANVYPAEVEAVLFNHPAIADVAVIGVPDPDWGEKVKAIVERRGDTDEQEIVRFCRDRLTHYKCPTSVDFVDQMPRDPSGKVRKRDLRQPYWAGAGRTV